MIKSRSLIVWWLLTGVAQSLTSDVEALAQPPVVDDRPIVAVDVHDPIDSGSSFAFLNYLHAKTDRELVRRLIERTLYTGDSLTEKNLHELRRNLLESAPISQIDILTEPSSGHPDSLSLLDGWSLYPEPISTDENDRVAILLGEHNLAGTGVELGFGVDLSSTSSDPRRYFLEFRATELITLPFSLEFSGRTSSLDDDLSVLVQRARYTDDETCLYGIKGSFSDGLEVYRSGDPGFIERWSADSIEATRIRSQAWFGSASNREDLFVGSASILLDRHTSPEQIPLEPAFSNTLGLFVGIASVARDYRDFDGFESTGIRFAPTGGMGRVSIGKFFGTGTDSTVDDLLYFGAEARQSIGTDQWFAHFSVEAGTGLRQKEAERTLLRGVASGGIQVGPGGIAFRSGFQVVWRWPRYIYSSANGSDRILRGYQPTEVFGDNHLAGNLEYRTDPFVHVGSLALSGVLFHDIAGFWNRGNDFATTRFHNASGLGVRIGPRNGYSSPIFRIDVAYNHDTGQPGEVSIGVSEAFDLFGFLGYIPPGPYLPR